MWVQACANGDVIEPGKLCTVACAAPPTPDLPARELVSGANGLVVPYAKTLRQYLRCQQQCTAGTTGIHRPHKNEPLFIINLSIVSKWEWEERF